MNIKSFTILCLAVATSPAFAQTAAPAPEPASCLSFNVGVVSDYRFRSFYTDFSLTLGKTVVAVGVKYTV